jgi:hypothetical protein
MPIASVVFGACVAACAVAHAAIFMSVLRRQGGNDVSAEVPRPNTVAEVFWAVIPLLALALVLLASYPRVRHRAMTTHASSLAERSR